MWRRREWDFHQCCGQPIDRWGHGDPSSQRYNYIAPSGEPCHAKESIPYIIDEGVKMLHGGGEGSSGGYQLMYHMGPDLCVLYLALPMCVTTDQSAGNW